MRRRKIYLKLRKKTPKKNYNNNKKKKLKKTKTRDKISKCKILKMSNKKDF